MALRRSRASPREPTPRRRRAFLTCVRIVCTDRTNSSAIWCRLEPFRVEAQDRQLTWSQVIDAGYTGLVVLSALERASSSERLRRKPGLRSILWRPSPSCDPAASSSARSSSDSRRSLRAPTVSAPIRSSRTLSQRISTQRRPSDPTSGCLAPSLIGSRRRMVTGSKREAADLSGAKAGGSDEMELGVCVEQPEGGRVDGKGGDERRRRHAGGTTSDPDRERRRSPARARAVALRDPRGDAGRGPGRSGRPRASTTTRPQRSVSIRCRLALHQRGPRPRKSCRNSGR